jgi:hypothetical protein
VKSARIQFIIALVALAGATQLVRANIIPYPNSGTENPNTYSFTATASGDLTGYFAAQTGAAYTEVVGLLDNGVLTSGGFGLNNHSTATGQAFDFGHVNAGDSLVFVLDVTAPPYAVGTVYSDPSLNASYDGGTGHNHIYSVAYDASTHLLDPSVPSGTYVAFEDLPAGIADFNYQDDTFVFTDTTTTVVPESSTCVAGALMLLPLGASTFRILRKKCVA